MIRTFGYVLIMTIALTSCVNHSLEHCHEGIVIGKIRSSGGGIAVAMKDTFFGDHEWQGHHNVIEALDIPLALRKPGTTIFLNGRFATNEEKNFPVTSDGDESAKPIIMVTAVSDEDCPPNQ